jgi:hypothetical protein
MSDDYYNDDVPEIDEEEMESYHDYLHGNGDEDDDYESEDASW